MDLGFEQLLAEHQEAFKDSEVFSNWMPPDGDYIVSISKFDAGQKVKDGVKNAWYKLMGRIEIEPTADPLSMIQKLKEKEFLINFYRSSAYGIMKGDARLLSENDSLDDLKEAYEVLEASVGTIIRVEVITSFSNKYKKDFTNCYIRGLVDTEVVGTASADETVTDPAEVPDGIHTAPA